MRTIVTDQHGNLLDPTLIPVLMSAEARTSVGRLVTGEVVLIVHLTGAPWVSLPPALTGAGV